MPRITHIRTAARLLLIALAALAPAHPASGQAANPVYFDDAPTAIDTMERIRQLAGIGNTDEAVRVLQQLLEDSADLLVVSGNDPDLFVPVRDRLHAMLRQDESLMSRYREIMSARAGAEYARDDLLLVERVYLYTPAGMEATLRLAQKRLESARFYAAWRTLAQLEGHPALDDNARARRAALSAHILGYLDAQGLPLDADDRALAERWSEHRADASNPPGTPARSFAITPNDTMEAIDIAGLLPSPLWSVDVGDRIDLRRLSRADQPDIPDAARMLYMVPAVDEHSVYVNDGFTITSWNRFSLSERWNTPVLEATARRTSVIRGRNFSDSNAVAVEGDWVVGIMGISVAANESKRSVAALSARDGRVRWVRSIDELGLTDLEQGDIVGPPVIDQRTVVLTVVKDVTRRRLHSIYAVALDLVTGELMWSRPMGSVGKLPYGSAMGNEDLPLIDQGVVYRSDRIGFMAAADVVTGRIIWARRFDYSQTQNRYAVQNLWAMSRPIVDGEKLYTLNPERNLVHVIRKDTGDILEQFPSSRLGTPDYLVRSGNVLIGVNPGDIYMVHLDQIDKPDAFTVVFSVPEPGVRGRVVASEQRVVFPTVTGVYHADPEEALERAGDPQFEFDFVRLDRPGNILPLNEELLVVDDQQVHTYLLWESAESVLTDRIEAEPRNAAHPVTYAELAFRAGRTELVVPATDKALRAIERDPLSVHNETARARLFSALLDMIDPPIGARVEHELDRSQRNEVLRRLELCASSPRETVAYLMVEGSVAEALKDPPRAVDAYQRILQTPTLADTMHFSTSRSVPADVEATRRLRSLIALHSREIYDAYDAEARRALESLESSRDPRDFERVARRYPVALTAPRAWLAAAERYERQGLARFATAALDQALHVAQDVLDPGDPLMGDIAGQLVAKLIRTGHYDRALTLLTDLGSAGPAFTLRIDGDTVERTVLERSIRLAVERRDKRPHVGDPVGEPETLAEWAVFDRPEAMDDNTPTDRIPMLSIRSEIAIFGRNDRGEFVRLWGDIPQITNELISFRDDGVLFATRDEPSVVDRSFTMLDLDTGRPIWKTRPFFSLFDEVDTRAAGRPDEIGRPIPRFDTPLMPNIRATALIHAMSPSTLVVVSAGGLAAAFDRATGDLLWNQSIEVNRVHSISVDGSTLAVGGIATEMPMAVQNDNGIDIAPGDNVIELFDIRTGRRLSRHTESSLVRWLTLTPAGDVVAGTDRAIIGFSPTRNAPIWRKEQIEELERSVRAWALPRRVLVQGADGAVWQIDPATGATTSTPVISERVVSGQWVDNSLVRVGENACVIIDDGLTLLDPNGRIVGADSRPAIGNILRPAFAQDRILVLSTQPIPIETDIPAVGYELTMHSNDTCKLLADPITVGVSAHHDAPDTIAVIDGTILISSGGLTYVIDAPPADRP